MMEFLKRVGWTVLDVAAFLLIAGVIAGLLMMFISFIPGLGVSGESEILENPIELLASFIPLLIGSLISGYIVHVLIFKRDLRLFGIGNSKMFKDYGWGFLLGGILVFVGFLILRLLGYLDVVGYNFEYNTIALFLLFFVVQSLFEEIAFRSYLMPALEARFGLWASLLVSSILFALIHLSNSNVAVLGIVNIFLAGLLLGVLFIKYQNVWVAAGLHCSWNYIQSTILGFEVSGESVFNMIETEEAGPDFLTGGAFGFEGSLISVLFLGGLIIYYIKNDPYVMSRLEGMPQIEDLDQNITV